MAKKMAKPPKDAEYTNQTPEGDSTLFDTEVVIPEEVQALAGAFEKALTAENKAKAKAKGAKQSVEDSMIEHGITCIPIRGGTEFLVLEENHSVKVRKPPKKEED